MFVFKMNSENIFYELTAKGVHTFFLTMAIITFTIKILRWLNVSQKTSDKFNKLQKRFFAGFVLFNFPIYVIGPFTSALYKEYGITKNEKATISILLNITISISSFFVGKIIKMFGHRKSIVIATLTSSIGNALRYFGTPLSFRIASLFIGFSAALSKIVLDDFFFTEESEINEPNSGIIFSENKSFFGFVIFLGSSPIGDTFYRYFSVEKIFLFASIVFALIIIPLWFLFYPTVGKKSKEESKGGFSQTMYNLTHPFFNLEFTTFAMVVCYEIIPVIFFSGLSSYFEGLPSGSISGIFGISKVFGVLLLQRIQNIIQNKIKILAIFCLVDIIFFLVFYKFYYAHDISLICFIMFGMADSIITAILLSFQKSYYHQETRATTAGISKFLTSLISSFIIYKLQSYSFETKIKVCITLIMLLPALGSMIYIYEQRHKEVKDKKSE